MKQALHSKKNTRSKLKRLLLAPLIYTAAILLLLEDWLWDISAQALAWLSKLPAIHQIEAQITRLPPYAALAAFILPASLLLPVKILALVLIAHGHAGLGIVVIIAAKIGGAAISARLYLLTRPALLTLPWFARWLTAFIRIKDRLIARLRATSAWRRLKRIRGAMRRLWRQWRTALQHRFAGGRLLRLIKKFSARKRFRDRS